MKIFVNNFTTNFVHYISDSFTQSLLNNAKVVHVSSCGAGIREMSSLADELFVVRCRQSQFEVWDVHNFTLARHVPVCAMKDPLSLVACPHYNCLYISEWGLVC